MFQLTTSSIYIKSLVSINISSTALTLEDLVKHTFAVHVVHLKEVLSPEYLFELWVLDLKDHGAVGHVRVVSASLNHTNEV